MKRSHVSISELMAAVLIVALDIGAVRSLMDRANHDPVVPNLIGFGALPMANLLVLGLIRLLRPPPGPAVGRPGLVGFEVFGAAAQLLFLGCIWLVPHEIDNGVKDLLHLIGLRPGEVYAVMVSALLLAPQLALALLGLRLGRTWSGSRWPGEVPGRAGLALPASIHRQGKPCPTGNPPRHPSGNRPGRAG